MKLELARQNDFDAIIAFYDNVTERTPEMATYARWSKGKHPTVAGIRAYINEGSMYLYRERGIIIGAMAVTMYQYISGLAVLLPLLYLYIAST